MPKENIDCTLMNELRVEVSWWPGRGEGLEGHVQVATVNTTKPQGEGEEGWFATLDRAGINRMIRALRKARDSAYGADA